MAEERLQKILSGLCSRRAAERHILAGRVKVNGETAYLGQRADPARDQITLDGVPVSVPSRGTYIMLNKPRGYVTTALDERGRPTVLDLCGGCGARVYPVGRLDLNSEGLLLLTDDGEAAKKLTHPRHRVGKEYLVWTVGDLARALALLREPMTLDGHTLRPPVLRLLRGRTEGADLLSMVIYEGKNRQVRKMCEKAGLRVVRLRRVAVGALKLGELPSGHWRRLTEDEISYIRGIT